VKYGEIPKIKLVIQTQLGYGMDARAACWCLDLGQVPEALLWGMHCGSVGLENAYLLNGYELCRPV
jgi:hypothetical protein